MRKSDPKPDPDTMALAEELRLAVGTFVRAIRNDAATPRTAQSDTLDLLDRSGTMNIATMAQGRHVTHQTMRLIVLQLEKAGYVERNANPVDGRSQLFSLTGPGRAELARGRDARAATIEALISTTLSREDRDLLRKAIRLLKRISAGLDAGSVVSRP